MKTTWAVSHGEYDAYRVVCLCPDEATANAARDLMNVPEALGVDGEGPYFVEEFRTIDAIGEIVVVTQYFVGIDLDGQEIRRDEPTYYLAWDAEENALTSGPSYEYQSGVRIKLKGAHGGSTVGYDEALASARDELAKAKAEAIA